MNLSEKTGYGRLMKAMAILLCVLTVFLLPVQVSAQALDSQEPSYAAEIPADEAYSPQPDESTDPPGLRAPEQPDGEPAVIAEDIEKRDEHTKHFLLDDGSYMAAQYSYPVHFTDENGNWIDCDSSLTEVEADPEELAAEAYELASQEQADEALNAPQEQADSLGASLSEQQSGADKTELKNKAGKLDIRLSKHLKKSNAVKIKLGDYKISWGFLNASKAVAQQISKDEAYGGDSFTSLKNLFSTVRYENAFENVDLEYTVTPVGVKENIILKRDTAQNEFLIEYKLSGLNAVQRDSHCIELKAPDGELVYLLEAPNMTDEAGAASTDIAISILSQKNNKLTVKLSADGEWLKSSDRKYPVTLDPSFITGQTWQTTDCTYADSANPNTAFGMGSPTGYMGTVYAGYYGEGDYRTYIKMNSLPKIGGDSVVLSAAVNLAPYNPDFFENMAIYAYEVTANWSQGSLTWNNKPSCSGTAIDYMTIKSGSDYSWKSWDITSCVKGWYNGKSNYGIMLMPDENTSNQCAGFYSSNYPADIDVRPAISIVYRDTRGFEPTNTYTTVAAGVSGSMSVNNYTGRSAAVHSLCAVDGLRMPVDISLIYNQTQGYSENTANVGNAWQLNLAMMVLAETRAELKDRYPYRLVDSDGTSHFFYKDSSTGKMTDEDGLGYTLVKTSSGFTVTDKKDGKMYFDVHGLLTKIADSNSNTIELTYTSYTKNNITYHKITKVTDGAKRIYSLAYNSSNFLTSVTDPAGRVYKLSYASASGGHTLLAGIEYPDGNKTSFTYSSNRSLIKTAQTNSAYTANCTYSSSSGAVSSMHIENGGKILRKYSFDYSKLNVTTVKEHKATENGVLSSEFEHIVDYQFNNYAQTVGVVNRTAGMGQYFQFGAPGVTNGKAASGSANKLLLASKTQQYIKNYVKNPLMSKDPATSYTTYRNNTTGYTVSYEQAYGHNDKKSVKLTRSASHTGMLWQEQDITGLAAGEYTISAYFSTNGAALTGGGAVIYAEIKDSSGGGKMLSDSEPVMQTGQNEWVRRQLTVTVNKGDTLRVFVGNHETTTGTFYIDDIQVEKGSAANRFNYVENSDFTGTDKWGSVYAVEPCVTLPGFTKALRLDSRVENKTPAFCQTFQYIYVSGKAGDVFTYGGWTKASSAELNKKFGSAGTTEYQLRVEFVKNGSVIANSKPHLVKGNTGVSDWQYLCGQVIAPGDYDYAYIAFDYNYNVNTAFLTGVMMYKDDFGQSYAYDDKGNLISSVDLAKSQSQFEYSNNNLSKIINPTGSKYTYTYDGKHNLTAAESTDGQKYTFTYDNYGNPTKSTLTSSSGDKKVVTSASYTDDYNSLASTVNELGNTTTYSYGESTGLLNSVTDPEGYSTSYTYNSSDQITSVSSDNSRVNYAYDSGRKLKKITSGDKVNYGFEYDSLDRRTAVTVFGSSAANGFTLASYEYNPHDLLTKLTYGNGNYVSYSYDNLDRLIEKSYNSDTSSVKYGYNAEGNLSVLTDEIAKSNAFYEYDMAGRLTSYRRVDTSSNGNGATLYESSCIYAPGLNRIQTSSVYVPNVMPQRLDYSYVYGTQTSELDRLKQIKENGAEKLGYSYDSLGRLSSGTLKLSSSQSLTTTYGYTVKNGNDTTQLSSYKLKSAGLDNTYTYKYDSNGNITHVFLNGEKKYYYTYDALNQLSEEYDYDNAVCYTYDYDNRGNLIEIYRSDIVAGSVNTTSKTPLHEYTYGNGEWADLVTKYDGKAILYDEIGNPTQYINGTLLKWKNGRQLSKHTKGGLSTTYTYDGDGQRLSKSNSLDGEIQYVYDGTRLVAQIGDDDSTLFFKYDATGRPYSLTKNNGTEYFYAYNAQGDVIALLTSSGVPTVYYTYDAWGKLLSITNQNGKAISGRYTLANQNPFRYRGYYYDIESGFYYLNSRYYDPELKRFINADGTLGQIGNVQGCNMFAYSFNNPVLFSDPSGNWPSLSQIFIGIAVVAVAVAAVAAVVATAGAAAPAFAVAGGGIIGGISSGAAATAATIAYGAFYVAMVSSAAAAISAVAEKNHEQKMRPNNTVYRLVDDNNKTQYVGRTTNIDAREQAHKLNPYRKDLHLEVIASNLNYYEARGLEQMAMLECHTINTKNRMNNQINGISPSNKSLGIYMEAGRGVSRYLGNQISNEILYWTGI